jgi:signal transduction histidine kinase
VPEDEALERLRRRYERERAARREAEAIAERVTGELYAATGELQAANQAIRDFVAIASHDLKGPLTTVIGAASLLQRRWPDLSDAQRDDLLGAIERQGGHLTRMVDDLLTLSKIESGALEPKARAVALRHAIDGAIEGFMDRAPDVVVLVDDGLAAECDPEHLHRILTNFVGNALKYGSPPVEVVCESADGWIEIRVRDHGDGVPADFVPRLFGKFARAESALQEKGSGLGLSIVRGLAEINGGRTWYEPNDPSGSCFGVRLKRAG